MSDLFINKKKLATEVNITFDKPHPGQVEVLNCKAEHKMICAGRRFGKSKILSVEAIMEFIKGGQVWFCAPTYEHAQRMYQEVVRILRDSNLPGLKTNATKLSIVCEHIPGAFIEFKSLKSYDNLRGQGLSLCIIDEAAYVDEEAWEEVLSPMLLTNENSRAIFASTPNGLNWFYDLYVRGMSGVSDWQSFHFTSYDNPFAVKSKLKEKRDSLPDRVFRQEFLAEFLSDGGAVFRKIKEAIMTFDELETAKSTIIGPVVLGVDLAQVNDFSAIVAIDCGSNSVIEIDYFNQTSWEVQKQRIKSMSDKWNAEHVLIEINKESKMAEDLYDMDVPVIQFFTSRSTKPEIIMNLVVAFENGVIRIPNHKEMVKELQQFTVTRSDAGNIKYGAPSGKHDDLVMALAIAWEGVIKHGSTVSFVISY